MAKNAPKSLVKNPTVSMSTHDLIEDKGHNKAGNARKIGLTILVGEAEVKTAKIKEDGKEKEVSWTVLGTVDLGGTFVIDGVECRLVATKRFGRIPTLEVRAVTTTTGSAGESVEL
jgi:hypothetical protein